MNGDEARVALERVHRIANNALYFDDSSDYGTALWQVLDTITPEIFKDNDLPELQYIPDPLAEEDQ